MLLALLLSLAPAGNSDVIRLSPGQQEVFKYAGLKKVAITREDYATVRVTKEGELLVTGVQPGKTSMTLWVLDKIVYKTIVVDSGRGGEIARLVREQVSPSLTVQEYGSKVVIEGTLDAVEELDRLRVLVGDDPNVKILAHMNPRVLPVVAAQITQALDKAGLRTARATAVGNKIFLEGSVADMAESHKAEQIANAIYGQTMVGLSTR